MIRTVTVQLFLISALALSLTYTTNLGFACDTCGTSSAVQVPGLLSSLRTTGIKGDTWTASVQQQVNSFAIKPEARLQTANNSLSLVRLLSVTQLAVGYNPSESISLQTSIPIVSRHYDRFERFSRVTETEVGLGDATILGTYSPYSSSSVDERVFTGILAGIKAPTGDPGSLSSAIRNGDKNGEASIQGRGFSLGTGSVDVPFGGVVYARSGRYVVFANAIYTFRGQGASDYRFANDLTWSAAPGWLFVVGEEETLTVSLSLAGEHKGLDRLEGSAVSSTSSQNVYAGPDLFFSIGNQFSIQLSVELPISVDVGGAAVEPESRSRAALMWRF